MTPFENSKLSKAMLDECTQINLEDCKLVKQDNNKWMIQHILHPNVGFDITEQFDTLLHAYKKLIELRNGSSLA